MGQPCEVPSGQKKGEKKKEKRERERSKSNKITGSGLPGRGSSRGLGTPSFDTNFASWNCADTEKRRSELEVLPVWMEVNGRRPPSRRTDRLDAIVVRAIELQPDGIVCRGGTRCLGYLEWTLLARRSSLVANASR